MSDVQSQEADRAPVGNLTDFVTGVDKNNPLHVEVSVNEDGHIIVFHNKQFKTPVSWYEYDVEGCRLDFVMDEGETRDAGMPIPREISKHMHNTHQILTILLDDETGQAKEGIFIPLIVHQI